MNPKELEQHILRRLAAVDMRSGLVNKPVVELALIKFLDTLGFSPRPVTWAKDGQHAQALAARSSFLSSTTAALRSTINRCFGAAAERADASWTDARESAKAVGHGSVLEIVKGLLRGFSVRQSVPWSFYEGIVTGDRGRRSDPASSPTWEAATDALDYAARACAECAWARTAQSELDGAMLVQQPEGSRSYEGVWLPFVNAFEAGLWIFWVTDSELVALTRPKLQLNAEQLHSADGPAVSWPEGEEQYFFLNGVHVPQTLVETSAAELDPRLLLRERNTEVRREIVRKIGIERVCQVLETECLDRQGNYELLLLDLQDGRSRPFLKMRNPSIGVYHIEGVAPGCRTVAEALAWRNQSDVPPSVLT